jgi:hypothetical protein
MMEDLSWKYYEVVETFPKHLKSRAFTPLRTTLLKNPQGFLR